jgi:two-component system chemotaxis response regulator CheB
MNKIRVLVVDDSAIVRKTLSRLIDSEPDMEVVGTAPNPYIARDKLVKLKPDVMTLDIEMPKMDGITFLNKVMHYFPVPTIIVSSVTSKGCSTSMKALELGAVSVIPKPSESYSIDSIEHILINNIRAAQKVKVKKLKGEQKKDTVKPFHITTTDKIIAIGASTGGTEAVRTVLEMLPANSPGILIVQHMPKGFTKAFAERLDTLCKFKVKEAEDGEIFRQNTAYIAPGDYHLLLKRSGGQYVIRIKKGPLVWYQRPAVDVLFKSVALAAGQNAVSVILTGMGQDGAKGLAMMKEHGAVTIAQDEKSCVVYGMPKAAFETGAVDFVESLDNIAKKIHEVLH